MKHLLLLENGPPGTQPASRRWKIPFNKKLNLTASLNHITWICENMADSCWFQYSIIYWEAHFWGNMCYEEHNHFKPPWNNSLQLKYNCFRGFLVSFEVFIVFFMFHKQLWGKPGQTRYRTIPDVLSLSWNISNLNTYSNIRIGEYLWVIEQQVMLIL